jgi:hypothetical protein
MKMRVAALAAVLVGAGAFASASDVAVIVHPSNVQADISMSDLVRVFRLDQPRWKAGDKIDLVLQAGVSSKQDIILSRIFHMKVDELQAFWLGRVFRGELPAPPRAFASDVSVRQYVAANPRAIGYIDAAMLDETVKVLRIDGKQPGDTGYVLARDPGSASLPATAPGATATTPPHP